MQRSRLAVIAPIAVAVAALILLGLLAVFVNTAIGYIPVLTLLVLLALCWAYLMIIKRFIVFSEGGNSGGCVRGEALRFPLTVKNESFLPAPCIEVLFYISDIYGGQGRIDRQMLTLPPHAEKVFDLGVRFDHIGTVEVGIRRVTIFDPVGLFFSMRENDSLHEVDILPRLVDVNRVEVSDNSLRESSKNIKTFINDGMDYSGIRDYHWGDPMKSIHWKLSSKSEGEYYTRLYETPTTPGVAIFMDFEYAGRDADAETLMGIYDTVVESALSTERFAVEAGFETELLFVDDRGAYQRIEGPIGERVADFMSHIPRVHAGSGDALLGLINTESKSMNCQNTLVVCSPNISEALVSTLVALEAPTRSPYLVAVDVADADGSSDDAHAAHGQLKRRLSRAHLPYTVVRDASDLQGGGR